MPEGTGRGRGPQALAPSLPASLRYTSRKRRFTGRDLRAEPGMDLPARQLGFADIGLDTCRPARPAPSRNRFGCWQDPTTMLALKDVEPMLLVDRRPPVPTHGWVYELKHDGYRVMARVDDGHVELRSRRGASCAGWYPEVASGLAQLHGQHLFDGEVCVLDEFGRSDFDRLHDRSLRRKWYAGADPVAFLVFDLLAFNGADIRDWPLERRKEALQRLLTPAPTAVLYVSHLDSDGDQLYATACALGLEGIVCKRLGSPYADGQRSGDWLKVKRPGAVPAGRFKRQERG